MNVMANSNNDSNSLFSRASAIIAAFFIGGCASSVIAPSAAKPVPGEYVLRVNRPALGPTTTVVITRDGGGPTDTRWLIYIDGEVAVRLGRSEQYILELPAGEHIFGIEPDAAIKVLQVENIDQTFTATQTYYLRAMFTGEGYRLHV